MEGRNCFEFFSSNLCDSILEDFNILVLKFSFHKYIIEFYVNNVLWFEVSIEDKNESNPNNFYVYTYYRDVNRIFLCIGLCAISLFFSNFLHLIIDWYCSCASNGKIHCHQVHKKGEERMVRKTKHF